MRTERLTFTGASGDELAARLDLPIGEPLAYALFAHCFTCSKDVHAVRRISLALADRGFAVLRFDFTGLGDSEGELADTTFSSNVEDVIAAARHLEGTGRAPSLLIGHSLGGAAMLRAARELESVEAVATVGAPCDPTHVRALIDEAIPELEERGEAQVTLAGRSFRIKKQFLEDLDRHDMEQRIHGMRRPLLVLHSPTDSIVGVDNARCIFEAAMHPKSFVALDGADHLLTRPEDAEYAADVIAVWARRHVTLAERETTEHGEVLVRLGASGYTVEAVAGHHRVIGDEPKDVGGDDLGPTPYDFLLAGLGSCTAMTLRMYAKRKQWPLEGVEVHLSHGHIHAKDCEDCEKESGKIDVIQREVTVIGDELDDEQRERLIEIANKCPVHRTLTNEIKIRTTAG